VPAANLATWKGATRPIIVDVDTIDAGDSQTYSYMCDNAGIGIRAANEKLSGNQTKRPPEGVISRFPNNWESDRSSNVPRDRPHPTFALTRFRAWDGYGPTLSAMMAADRVLAAAVSP
jgi:hypothetical protein